MAVGRRLLVACYDAGGAEVVSSWINRNLDQWPSVLHVLDGPAVEVFRHKTRVHNFLWARELGFFDVGAQDFVLCGSSATSTLERGAVARARELGVPCAVYLDHWKNYAARFRDGVGWVMPDEVWVTDRWAADLARRELPEAAILTKGNPYVEDVLAQVRYLEQTRKRDPQDRLIHLVYVSEPGREKEFHRWLRYGNRQGYHWRARPHPAEREAEHTLAEDIAWADVIVGCDSMAMAVARRAGKRVISVLPRGEELTVPYEGIERAYTT